MSKCANPDCSAKFRYLHDGKVFRIELDHRFAGPEEGEASFSQPVLLGHRGPQLLIAGKPESRPEYFWLCGDCSQHMTVSSDQNGIVLVSLVKQDLEQAAALCAGSKTGAKNRRGGPVIRPAPLALPPAAVSARGAS